MSYIDGERNQILLMQSSIEEYIAANDSVRAYDAMIEKFFFGIKSHFTITLHIYGLLTELNLTIGRYLISVKNIGSPQKKS